MLHSPVAAPPGPAELRLRRCRRKRLEAAKALLDAIGRSRCPAGVACRPNMRYRAEEARWWLSVAAGRRGVAALMPSRMLSEEPKLL
ncbi:hypothetical protein P4133_05070 [Pseudomonas aeruginosa]|nr:hypothetical protein [Pseudomonas aeruginosa]